MKKIVLNSLMVIPLLYLTYLLFRIIGFLVEIGDYLSIGVFWYEFIVLFVGYILFYFLLIFLLLSFKFNFKISIKKMKINRWVIVFILFILFLLVSLIDFRYDFYYLQLFIPVTILLVVAITTKYKGNKTLIDEADENYKNKTNEYITSFTKGIIKEEDLKYFTEDYPSEFKDKVKDVIFKSKKTD